MKRSKVKIVSILLIALSVISIGINVNAHSGRTDANGGHRDNKNKSGLGSYHYHCGGHPAHLHTNGICPYASNSSSKSRTSSSSSSSTSNSKTSTSATTTTTPTTIDVTEIQINENVENLEVGKSKNLTVTIAPSDATDKKIIWKSSDESIATVSETGEVVAKKYGTVEITATSSNGKTSTIKINITNPIDVENNNIAKISTTSANDTANNATNNTETSNTEESNPLAGIITLGLLGGGYWGYKKYKKSK